MIASADFDPAGIRRDEAEQAAQQAGLARTVHAHERNAFPSGNFQRDLLQRHMHGVAFGHVIEAKCGRVHAIQPNGNEIRATTRLRKPRKPLV
ncbi:MAG TPA: hypothetical protein VFF16_03000, partial [Telluria sp.]|nr:hypothetical protein [Telluria sp.]